MNPSSRYAKAVEEIENCKECAGFVEGWDIPCAKHIDLLLKLVEIRKKMNFKELKKVYVENPNL